MFFYQRAILFILYYVVHILHFIRSLFVPHQHLSHEQRVSRCYHFLHYAVSQAGAFSEYTEARYCGHEKDYQSTDKYYHQAWNNKLDDLLDAVHIKKNMKLLDAGCGNGDLSYKAKFERGATTLGLTLSPQEIAVNKKRGLDAMCVSYKCLDGKLKDNEFDAIISNGSSEHLFGIEDACANQGQYVIKEMLRGYWRILKPGGFLCFTWCHFRENVDPNKAAMEAWEHPVESDDWHWSVITHFYSGWYPHGDIVENMAKQIGFTLIEKKDTTKDVLITSLVWRRSMAKALRSFKGLFWCWYIALYELVNDPIYLYYCIAYKYGHSWTWQFENRYDAKTKRVKPSAAVHYTITFKKP